MTDQPTPAKKPRLMKLSEFAQLHGLSYGTAYKYWRGESRPADNAAPNAQQLADFKAWFEKTRGESVEAAYPDIVLSIVFEFYRNVYEPSSLLKGFQKENGTIMVSGWQRPPEKSETDDE